MLSQFVAYQMHSLLMLTEVLHLIIVHIGCYEEKNVHRQSFSTDYKSAISVLYILLTTVGSRYLELQGTL